MLNSINSIIKIMEIMHTVWHQRPPSTTHFSSGHHVPGCGNVVTSHFDVVAFSLLLKGWLLCILIFHNKAPHNEL